MDSMRKRQLDRLLEELHDEAVPIAFEGRRGRCLLDEIDYARHPTVHERTFPTYGAMVLGDDWESAFAQVTRIPTGTLDLDRVRRFADGRHSFVLRAPDGVDEIAAFPISLENEYGLVELQRHTGATIVQRTRTGSVRVVLEDGVLTWDTVRWTMKPAVDRYELPIRYAIPQADPEVLRSLLDFCVHVLSAGSVGAILVWYLCDVDFGDLHRVDTSQAWVPPPFDLRRHSEFGAVRSALAQMDRAAVVAADGEVSLLGVHLASTDLAERLVRAEGGTRHTAAKRFSYDEPRALCFVVSEDGPVSVYSDGRLVASVEANVCDTPLLAWGEAGAGATLDGLRDVVRCPACDKSLAVEVVAPPPVEMAKSNVVRCPVCQGAVRVGAPGARVAGVVKRLEGP